jgi:hypothetical protein
MSFADLGRRRELRPWYVPTVEVTSVQTGFVADSATR